MNNAHLQQHSYSAAAGNAITPSAFLGSKVHPPRMQGGSVGVFASRSPHRPNPLGLTLAKLDRVAPDERPIRVYLSNIDLVEGTPVLDIKPFHPSECMNMDTEMEMEEIKMDVNAVEATTLSTTASTAHTHSPSVIKQQQATPKLRIPNWLRTQPEAYMNVRWTARADQQLRDAVTGSSQTDDSASSSSSSSSPSSHPGLEFYSSSELSLVRSLIDSILSQDPRSTHSKLRHTLRIYALALDRLDVCFRVLQPDQPQQQHKNTNGTLMAESDASMQDELSAAQASPDSADISMSPSDASPSPSPSEPPSSAPSPNSIPTAEIFRIVYYPPGTQRPRLRTKEWLVNLLNEETEKSGSDGKPPATNP